MKSIVKIGTVVLVLLFATQLWATEEGPNVAAKAGATTVKGQAVSNFALASQLAEYGAVNENASALLLAAQIMKASPAQDVALAKKSEGKETPAAQAKTATVVTSQALLEQAKLLAAADLTMIAAIDAEMHKQGTRGDVTGPNRHEDRIQPRDTDIYKITFRGGEKAEVGIQGDGDNDLDLFVYDSYGNLIGKDVDSTDQCYVGWTPKWTAEYTIKIKNLGHEVYSNYMLLTN